MASTGKTEFYFTTPSYMTIVKLPNESFNPALLLAQEKKVHGPYYSQDDLFEAMNKSKGVSKPKTKSSKKK